MVNSKEEVANGLKMEGNGEDTENLTHMRFSWSGTCGYKYSTWMGY